MAVRRYVTDPPRIIAVCNATLDVVVQVREPVPVDSIDDVTLVTPLLGDPVNLTGFTNLRAQIRASVAHASLLSSSVTDDTPRCTLACSIYDDPTLGKVRMIGAAERLWAMQQAGVKSAHFDLTGVDNSGQVWSLVTAGQVTLLWGITPPFASSASDPSELDADVFPSGTAQLGGTV